MRYIQIISLKNKQEIEPNRKAMAKSAQEFDTDEFEDQIGVTRFVRLNGVPTKIVIFDSERTQAETSVVQTYDYDRMILMISGNPGEVEYYRNFLSLLHERTNLPIIGVSNSGHNRMPDNVSMPDIDENPDLYSLDGQTANKAAFIERFIAPRTRLILLAHSIGSYMCIELLSRHAQIEHRVDHCIVVMPSIERMAETDSGKSVTRLFTVWRLPLLAAAYALDHLLPDGAKRRIIDYVLRRDIEPNYRKYSNSSTLIPECVSRSATALFDTRCLRALIHMTRYEFAQVIEPNIDAIERYRTKLTMLYGENDHWCPVPYYERLRARVSPQVDMRLCLRRHVHAFVVDRRATDEIARIVADIIFDKLKRLPSHLITTKKN